MNKARRHLGWLLCLWALGPAHAASDVELGSVRARYGVVQRTGSQADDSPGVGYNGRTPNDVGLSGAYFGRGWLGAQAALEREGFALLDGTQPVARGAVFRARVGPAARYVYQALTLEGFAGYGYAQLPFFRTGGTLALTYANRHAVLLGARVALRSGAFLAELRGELPLGLSVRTPQGNARSTGYRAALGVGAEVVRTGPMVFALLLEGTLTQDAVRVATTRTEQRLIQAGLAVQVAFRPAGPPPPPPPGRLELQVQDDQGRPLADAPVVAVSEAAPGPRQGTAGANGRLALAELPPGTWMLRVEVRDFLPFEQQVEVQSGATTPLTLQLTPEPPKTGNVALRVVDKETSAALKSAAVEVLGSTYVPNADGVISLVGLPPGPLEVNVKADGYTSVAETLVLVAGKTTEVQLGLEKKNRKAPASVSGLVRSRRGGRPVTAELFVPQTKLTLRANRQGAFSFSLPGGTYDVRISARGFRTQTKTLTVNDGEKAILNVDLQPLR